jgi:methyl-accepting chemotaxis protein
VETAKSLTEIKDGITKAAVQVAEIAQSSHEQAASVNQINTAVQEVAKAVTTTTASAEETAASSQELNSQTIILNESIARFKLKD